jgi:hypothetical protein
MSENTQTLQNNDEFVNSLIERESDRAISLIRLNNVHHGSLLSLLTKEQKNMFVYLVREYYFKKLNSINGQNNDFELIFYNPFIKKFSVPLDEELSDGTKTRIYINLSFDQFIRAIIHAIIIGIFKIEDQKKFVTTNFGNSVLTHPTDELELQKYYPYVTGKIYLEMISDPLVARQITYLAARVSTDELQVNPVLMEINQKIGPPAPEPDEITGHLPIPPTPPGGWPSDKKGGKNIRKTNRKRKYKTKSKSKSNTKSKKRRYKSRSHRRNKR